MISIAMTTYNGEKYISKQIDSILNQTYKDFELVICDDNSTDNTFSILTDYAVKDARIHVYKNSVNLGFLKNFEKCIGLTSKKYIALSDQDDIWTPDHLEILYEAITKEGCSLVGGNAKLIDENDNLLGGNLINHSITFRTKEDFGRTILYRNFFQGAATLFSRDVIETALPFPDGTPFHDWWLALTASEKNGIFYINTPILYYRQHLTNVTGVHKTKGLMPRIRSFFSIDKKRMDCWARIISTFSMVSINTENVKEVEKFINNTSERNINAIKYFFNNYKSIYGCENLIKTVLRKVKFILTFSL